MTVKELMARLETMPQDLEVECEIVKFSSSSIATQEIDDIYESTDNKVIIQGYQY